MCLHGDLCQDEPQCERVIPRIAKLGETQDCEFANWWQKKQATEKEGEAERQMCGDVKLHCQKSAMKCHLKIRM